MKPKDKAKVDRCPTCKQEAQPWPQNRNHPFCSERCRMIDLGNWLDEGYRVPAVEPPEGVPEE